jgi:hypothetical protein
MKYPQCDLKGHGPCSGPICQRGLSLNHMCDGHVRLQSYWTEHNPGKKLNEWLDCMGIVEREEILRKSPARGKHWREAEERPTESSDDE